VETFAAPYILGQAENLTGVQPDLEHAQCPEVCSDHRIMLVQMLSVQLHMSNFLLLFRIVLFGVVIGVTSMQDMPS
jgi:hypothetical protein